MPCYAANLSWLYTDLPMPARYEAARADGFHAFECMFPYESPVLALQEAREQSGLPHVLLNAPAGDWAAGERGLAALPNPADMQRFRAGFLDQAVPYANALGCSRIHVLAGLGSLDDVAVRQTYVANLRWACEQAAQHGISVTIEPLNGFDVPGYALLSYEMAGQIIDSVAANNLGLQLDLYHAMRMGLDPLPLIKHWVPTGRLHHMQVAGAPQRNEPHLGVWNWSEVVKAIDASGYVGWVGAEYQPSVSGRDQWVWMEGIS